MKLQLTIASGTVLDIEIRLDDTFKSLITRTFEESGIKLQLYHFGNSGKKIKYTDNVVNYFVGPDPPEPEQCSYFPAQMCRLCAKTSEDMEFIFGTHSSLEESINTWLPTQVSETDMLPKQVCIDCIEKLQMCKNFQIECVQAEVILKDLLDADKFSICKKRVEAPVEETSGPRVFECGFVFGQRSALHSAKPEDKNSTDYCCPLCYEGKMVKTGKYVPMVFDDTTLTHMPILNTSNIVTEEIKMESFDEYDFGEDPLDMGLRVIKTETEVDYADEEDVNIINNDQWEGIEINDNNTTESALATTSNGHRNKRSYPGNKTAATSDHEDFENQISLKIRTKTTEGNVSKVVTEDVGLAFKCTICEEQVGSMDDLLEHAFELHSDNEFFPCPFCPLAFDIAPQLMIHFESKHNPPQVNEDNVDILMHRCEQCFVFFPSDDEVKTHECASIAEKKTTAAGSSKKPNRNVPCPTCGKQLKSKIHLEFHMQFHIEGIKPLYCQICHEDFETEESLYKHFRWFHNNQEPKCSICDKSFANYNTLIIHKKLHSNIRNYQCGTCSKSFLDKQTLAEHIVTHMETTPFQCHICKKYLARNSRLKQHMLIHQKQNNGPQDIYDCSVCRQVYPSQAAAVAHAGKCHENAESEDASFEIKTVDKVFRCEFCNQNFGSIGVLNEHREMHDDGPKKFACEFCDSTFESFARLTSHKLKHIGMKGSKEEEEEAEDKFTVPLHYVCNECNQTYFLWSYLSIHKRQKHAEVRCLYSCKMCPDTFETSWSLAYHRKAKHGQVKPKNSWWGKAARIHECNNCDKLFASHLLLAKHQAAHHAGAKVRRVQQDGEIRVQCDTCGKTFSKQAYLEKHMKIHTEGKTAVCSHCGRKFVHESSLNKHMKTHTSRFPHQCNFCQKRFLMMHELEVHTRRHTGYKPHHCEACDKSFRTKSMLVQHMRIHTNERPYPCDICDLAFRRSWALKNHKRIHTGQKPFGCAFCNRTFRVKQDLQTHLAKMHSTQEEVKT